MNAIKERLKSHLETVQEVRCAFCSSRLNVGGRAEIEHIAPKGILLYPEFTFNAFNLVYACQHCNSSSKKGTKDVILKHSKYYRRCKFSIVHPYFDNPDNHYDWANKVKICIISKSTKADESIGIFELDSPYLTEQRAMNLQRERTIKQAGPNSIVEKEIMKGLNLLP